MGKRACMFITGIVLLLAAATPAWAKDGIFSRFQRTLQRDTTKQESAKREAQASAAAAAGTIVDAWSNDPILRMAQRALDGDHNGVLLDMFNNPNMAKVWQDPKVSRHLLNGMPILKTFKGMEQFMGKDTLTPDDGLKAFELLKKYVTVFPTKMEGVLNSDKMADKIRSYANTQDEGLKSLYKLVEGGDFNALKQLNKNIADKEWGGILNLDVLGMDGKEPESTQILRKTMMGQEPDLFRLVHQDDEYIKGYIVDPTKAYREAMQAAGLN